MPTRSAAATLPLGLSLGLLALAACDQTLETGYAPRALNSTEADRRSYYAPAFSPGAKADHDSGPAFNFGR